MHKKIYIILLFFFQIFQISYAENIPDPTKIPESPTVVQQNQENQSQSLEMQGIIIAKEQKLNQLIISGQNYKVGDIIEGQWKIIEISSKKIIFKNLLDHHSKVIHLGENQ